MIGARPGAAVTPGCMESDARLARTTSALDSSAEMALRKRAAGTRLQVALESDRCRFIGTLDRRDQSPRLVAGGVNGLACVVRVEPLADIARQSYVGSPWIGKALEHVNESLGRHPDCYRKLLAVLHLRDSSCNARVVET